MKTKENNKESLSVCRKEGLQDPAGLGSGTGCGVCSRSEGSLVWFSRVKPGSICTWPLPQIDTSSKQGTWDRAPGQGRFLSKTTPSSSGFLGPGEAG